MAMLEWYEYHITIRKKRTGDIVLRKHVLSATRLTRAQLRIEALEGVREKLGLDHKDVAVEVQG